MVHFQAQLSRNGGALNRGHCSTPQMAKMADEDGTPHPGQDAMSYSK